MIHGRRDRDVAKESSYTMTTSKWRLCDAFGGQGLSERSGRQIRGTGVPVFRFAYGSPFTLPFHVHCFTFNSGVGHGGRRAVEGKISQTHTIAQDAVAERGAPNHKGYNITVV